MKKKYGPLGIHGKEKRNHDPLGDSQMVSDMKREYGSWVAVKAKWTECPIGNPIAIVGGRETYERREKPGDHGDQYVVGEVSDWGSYGDKTVKAYAHLIAAAPDLLEACEEMIEHAKAAGMNVTKMRAAISKAKGQKP